MNKYLIGFGIVYLLISEATATATFEVPATGEHAFGPNETQTQACEMAASKAKKNALVKHFGELVGRESLLTCDSFVQIATGSDCDLFESSWSLINSNGFIKGTKNFQQAARFSESQRTNVCKVDAIFIIEEFA